MAGPNRTCTTLPDDNVVKVDGCRSKLSRESDGAFRVFHGFRGVEGLSQEAILLEWMKKLPACTLPAKEVRNAHCLFAPGGPVDYVLTRAKGFNKVRLANVELHRDPAAITLTFIVVNLQCRYRCFCSPLVAGTLLIPQLCGTTLNDTRPATLVAGLKVTVVVTLEWGTVFKIVLATD